VLADEARASRLVICAGAGLSVADDAALPSGRRLGQLLDERLTERLDGYVSPADTSNLLAVSDAAVAAAGGLLPLQLEVRRLADFDQAPPNYGHRALALLLSEGAVRTLLLWNWDNCVERAALEGEPLEVARTREDMVQLRVPAIAKVHGCVTRTPSLLITSAQLSEPPLWTAEAFNAALRGATGVFIGIGDVADYAQSRLAQLTEDFPELDAYVVSPSITSDWTDSVWATLMPDIDSQKRVPKSADAFLDDLIRAWALELPDRVEATMPDLATQALLDGLGRTLGAMRKLCGAEVVAWARRVGFRCHAGQSAIRLPPMQEALMAVGIAAGERGALEVAVLPDARCRLGASVVEVLVACEMVTATQVEREARRRTEQLAGRGLIHGQAEFMVAGAIGGALDVSPTLDLLDGVVEADDVFAGPRGVQIAFTRAADVLGRAT
jgi:hypothetical protein